MISEQLIEWFTGGSTKGRKAHDHAVRAMGIVPDRCPWVGSPSSRIAYVQLTPQLTLLITNMRGPSFVSAGSQEIRMETRFPDRIGSNDAVNAGFPGSKNTPRVSTSLTQTPGSLPLRSTHPRGLLTMPKSALIRNTLNT